jgi:hypothetical protein
MQHSRIENERTHQMVVKSNSGLAPHPVLTMAVGLGVVVVWAMLGMAFGPAAVLFGVIVAAIAWFLIVRRYRFSLRTFLLATTVLGVWLGLKVSHDARMDRALAGITASGGLIKVYDRSQNFPWGLWKYRYHLQFHDLREPLSTKDFSHLRAFGPASLHWLNLANTGLTDRDLEIVASLRGVEYLSLANETYANGEVIPDRPQNKITDAGLARLSGLRNLRGIDLSGAEITDDGLKILAGMPHLVWVYLDATQVKGPGLANLKTHDQLRMLELNGCELTPAAYENVIQLSNLSSLGLRNSGTTDALFALIEENANLGILRLSETQVSDEAVQRFQQSHPNCKVER